MPRLFTTQLVLIASVVLTICLFPGCGMRTGGRTGGSTTLSMTDPDGKAWSRQVTYALDSRSTTAASGVPRQDTMTITFDGGRLIIERARVVLNDKDLAQLPDSAKAVNIDYTSGKLTITADGNKAYEGKLPK